MMKLFTRKMCSECQRLKQDGLPDDVEVLDCDEFEALGDAAFYGVYDYPTLRLEDGTTVTGYDAIKEQLDESR